MKMMGVVAMVVNYVPFQELSSLSCLIVSNPSLQSLQSIYQLISKLIEYHVNYRKIIEEAGVLHMLISLLKIYSDDPSFTDPSIPLHSPINHDDVILPPSDNIIAMDGELVEGLGRGLAEEQTMEGKHEKYKVVVDMIILLIHGKMDHSLVFRENENTSILEKFLYNHHTRSNVLKIYNELIDLDPDQKYKDIRDLIRVIHPSIRKRSIEYKMIIDILNSLIRSFISNDKAKESFQEVEGYLCLIYILKDLESSSSSSILFHQDGEGEGEGEREERKCSLISHIFKTITISILSHDSNRSYFRENIVYLIQGILSKLAILQSPIYAHQVLSHLLSIATEDVNPIWNPERLSIINPEILIVLFELFAVTHIETQVAILKRILQVISYGKRSLESLCSLGLLDVISSHFKSVLLDPLNPLQPLFLSFIEQLAIHKISPWELKRYISIIEEPNSPPQLISSLSKMASRSSSIPYIEFDLQRSGYACIHLPSLNNLSLSRTWPPAYAYTLLFWIYIDTYDDYSQLIELFHFISDDKKSHTIIYLKEDNLILQTSSKSTVEFPFQYNKKQWYHIALVHSKSRFHTSEVKFYLDGELKDVKKSPYLTYTTSNVECFIGTPFDNHQLTDLIWRIGTSYLIEDYLTWEMILFAYCLGPRYTGNFQGQYHYYSTPNMITSRILSIIQSPDFKSASSLNIFHHAVAFAADTQNPFDQSHFVDFDAVEISEEKIIFSFNARNTKPSLPSSLPSYPSSSSKKGMAIGITIINNNLRGEDGELVGGSAVLAPSGISSGLESIGGVFVIFLLLEKVKTSESLLDTVHFLIIILKENPRIAREMERMKGYSLIARLLLKKKRLLSASIVDKLFELTGAVPGRKDDPIISNLLAFQSIILVFRLWKDLPVDIQFVYFKRMNSLLLSNPQAHFNQSILRKSSFLQKLLNLLLHLSSFSHYSTSSSPSSLSPSLSPSSPLEGNSEITEAVLNTITNYLLVEFQSSDLVSLTAFLITTLQHGGNENEEGEEGGKGRISIRNRILSIIFKLLESDSHLISFAKIITPSWVMIFIDRSLHTSTVMLGVKIFIRMIMQNKNNFKGSFEEMRGYKYLELHLSHLSNVPAIYYLLFQFLLGIPITDYPNDFLSFTITDFKQFLWEEGEEYKIENVDILSVISSILKRSCGGSNNPTPTIYTNWNIPGATDLLRPSLSLPLPSLPLSPSLPDTLNDNNNDNLDNNDDNDNNENDNEEEDINDEVGDKKEEENNSVDGEGGIEMEEAPHHHNSMKDGVILCQWETTDIDLQIQKTIILTLSLIFQKSADFKEKLFNSNHSERVIFSLISLLFPHGQLNFPSNDTISEEEYLENEKCQLSAKYIFDLLSLILLHSAHHLNGKLISTFEMIIDCVPINVNEKQFILLQSKLMYDFTLYIKTITKEQLGEDRIFLSNLSKFSSYLVDKVCSSLLSHATKYIFKFLVELIGKIETFVRDSSDPSLPSLSPSSSPSSPNPSPLSIRWKYKAELQTLYKSLNRLTIFILSLPFTSSSYDNNNNNDNDEEDTILFAIQSTINNQQVILNHFNTGNEGEFINVMCNILYKYLLNDKKELREGALIIWKLLLLSKPDLINAILIYKTKEETIDLTEGFSLLLHKDNFNQFYYWMGDESQAVHAVMEDQLAHIVKGYREGEISSLSYHLKQLKRRRQELHLKFEKSSRSSLLFLRRFENQKQSLIDYTTHHLLLLLNQHRHDESDLLSFISLSWRKLKLNFTREKRVLDRCDAGDGMGKDKQEEDEEEKLMKWKLDFTETPSHLRMKLVKNYNFYSHYPFDQSLYSSPNPDRYPRSSHTPLYHHFSSLHPNPDHISIDDDDEYDDVDEGGEYKENMVDISSHISPKLYDSQEEKIVLRGFEYLKEEFLYIEDGKIYKHMEINDDILYHCNCNRIKGLQSSPSLFVIGSHHLYLIPYLPSSSSSDSSQSSSSPSHLSSNNNNNNNEGKRGIYRRMEGEGKRWEYEDIKDIFLRSYLLRSTAIELYSSNGKNYFINLDHTSDYQMILKMLIDRKLIKISRYGQSLDEISFSQSDSNNFSYLSHLSSSSSPSSNPSSHPSHSSSPSSPSPSSMRRNQRKEGGGGGSMTQMWVHGHVSNFQYLMYLNTLAGRSLNDLSQYPIFPWIIADYESERLDLDDVSIYRDLSKPMGALSPDRAGEFIKRYEGWNEEENDIPRWHYGTHYTSAGIVLYYLIRMEPFTQQFLTYLQSGKFDVADRMFHSIKESYQSASGSTMNVSDVKELIPEFFYQPNFLINHNHFDFGQRQSDEEVNHILLPPWANNSPEEFIRIHRQALESNYVSYFLSDWIDLIFGYKQRGKNAEESLNVFYYLTYEGAIDLEKIQDPIERESVITQTLNFGQTPKQLFSKPHPRRLLSPSFLPSPSPSPSLSRSSSSPSLINSTSFLDPPSPISLSPSFELPSPPPSLSHNNSPSPSPSPLPSSSASSVPSAGSIYESSFLKMILGVKKEVNLMKDMEKEVHYIGVIDDKTILLSSLQSFLPSPTSSHVKYLSWGHKDRSIRLAEIETEKLVAVCENHHIGSITCLAVSEDGKYIVSGGDDTLVLIQHMRKTSRKNGDEKKRYFDISHRLCAHEKRISAIAISRSFNLLVTASDDSSLIVSSFDYFFFFIYFEFIIL